MNMKHTKYDQIIAKMMDKAPSYQVVGGKAYKPGLQTMLDFDKFLGHPSKKIKTIHVAGTNGKGSVSSFIAAALLKNGYKTGLYSSPHLVDFKERVRIDGQMISKEDVCEFWDKAESFINEKHPSFFEITTALAFYCFAKYNVNIAVIEVGLGGRLDSTNIITPLISVITSIAMDHMDVLGDTIEKIAFEKGGIIKQEIPAVIGSVPNEVRKVYKKISEERHSRVIFTDDLQLPKVIYNDMDLRGDYQVYNLQTANVALKLLEILYKFKFDSKVIKEAISHAGKIWHLRGRWEVLSLKPYVICDIAHNPQGLEFTMRQLSNIPRIGRLIIIIGMVSNKDIDAVSHLLPKDAFYYYTNAQGSRALPAKQLAEKVGCPGVICDSVENAINTYLEDSYSDDLVYIGGSSYVVGEVLSLNLFKK